MWSELFNSFHIQFLYKYVNQLPKFEEQLYYPNLSWRQNIFIFSFDPRALSETSSFLMQGFHNYYRFNTQTRKHFNFRTLTKCQIITRFALFRVSRGCACLVKVTKRESSFYLNGYIMFERFSSGPFHIIRSDR